MHSNFAIFKSCFFLIFKNLESLFKSSKGFFISELNPSIEFKTSSLPLCVVSDKQCSTRVLNFFLYFRVHIILLEIKNCNSIHFYETLLCVKMYHQILWNYFSSQLLHGSGKSLISFVSVIALISWKYLSFVSPSNQIP